MDIAELPEAQNALKYRDPRDVIDRKAVGDIGCPTVSGDVLYAVTTSGLGMAIRLTDFPE